MENHVYKHPFRHGHHHHKHELLFALLAMFFFSAITLGVVASIYYTMVPRMNQDQNQNVASSEGARCLPGYPECNDTPNQPNPAAGACLVGTVDCNDTPEMFERPIDAPELLIPKSENSTKFNSEWGYSVIVPAGLEAYGYERSQVEFGESLGGWYDWAYQIVAYNSPQDSSLEDAVEESIAGMVQLHGLGGYTDFYNVANFNLAGVNAKRITLKNLDLNYDTVIIAKHNGNTYSIKGKSYPVWQRGEDELDVISFLKTFEFIN